MKQTDMHPQTGSTVQSAGFSLIELLVVMGLMVSFMAVSGPAIRSMGDAWAVDRAILDLSNTLEMSRSYAMSRNTYVRVGMAQIANDKLVLIPIYAANGSLDQDASANMADPSVWPALAKPVVLKNVNYSNSFNGSSPETNNDDVPWNTSSGIDSFSRFLPGVSTTPLNFNACLQFQPSGEVRVLKNASSRYIKIPIDQVGPKTGRNPFIFRISGASGSIQVLRIGEGI